MKSESCRSSRSLWPCLALAALLLAIPAGAQSASAPVLVFDFTNPALSPSHWALTLHPDGSGHFTSETANQAPAGGGEMNLPSVDRDIQVSPQFAAGAFRTAQAQSRFNEDCESHMKVAFQGWKKISYNGPDGSGSCTFNYSKDKTIQSFGESMQGVATTILEGVRLEMLLQHDPLGLDKEMGNLVTAAHEGRARQIVAISAILQRLVEDDHVMDMVRKQARILLAQANS